MDINPSQKSLKGNLSKDKSPLIVEENLTPTQLDKREEYLKDLKKQKKNLVKRYGKDAEAVMYGRATNLVLKQSEQDNKKYLKELVKKILNEFGNI
jgi:alpha-galactosidase/6-phospho-beta-glucosidase family protein